LESSEKDIWQEDETIHDEAVTLVFTDKLMINHHSPEVMAPQHVAWLYDYGKDNAHKQNQYPSLRPTMPLQDVVSTSLTFRIFNIIHGF